MHVRITARSDVRHDGLERRGIKSMAVDLGTHGTQRVECRRVGHADDVSQNGIQRFPGAG